MRMFYAEVRIYDEYNGVGIFSTEEKAYEYIHKCYPNVDEDDIQVIDWVVDDPSAL
nr:MAG TPA: hypothetical protein [Caudoviricetes sp.]